MTNNSSELKAYAIEYDLSNCDKEPLHFIRLVQDQGCLLAVDPSTRKIIHVSDNVKRFYDKSPEDLLGTDYQLLFPKDVLNHLSPIPKAEELLQRNPISFNTTLKGEIYSWHLLAHINDQGYLILTVEPIDPDYNSIEFLKKIDQAIQKVQATDKTKALLQTASQQVKLLTGYDRVMIYQFDEQYNGAVVAESVEAQFEPFLDLHYPASDIPKQARAAYLRNKIRLIADVNGQAASIIPALHPQSQSPLDTGLLSIRGVSPIHLEYLRNMGVGATMSVGIIVNDQLWGLIACHHYRPKFVEYRTRQLIKFIGMIISGHLALQSANAYRQQVLQTNLVRSQLFDQMDQDWDVRHGLINGNPNILNITSGEGAALFLDNQLYLLGTTPNKTQILQIINWLSDQQPGSVYHTKCLSKDWEKAIGFAHVASGLLSIRISDVAKDYILWFKPEMEQTVTWGGNPNKAVTVTKEDVRLSPRKSFDKWKQQVKHTSSEWPSHEISIAQSLRNDIKDFIIQKYQEAKRINQELTESYEELDSFSYTVSHDLRAPLRIIAGYSEVLKEDYGDKLDSYGNNVLNTIINSAGRMNSFINDILAFSRLGRQQLSITAVDLRQQFEEIWEELILLEPKERKIKSILPTNFPETYGDRRLTRQLLHNLISNAIKYSRATEEAIIEISVEPGDRFNTFKVSDNGIGFDMKFAEKLFIPFHRLVSTDDYEGTGVGMAIAKRIIDQHQGKIWVESQKGIGTEFYFELPAQLDILAPVNDEEIK